MKTTKEKADELVDAHRTYIRQADKYTTLLSSDEVYLALKCAILSVKHTIEVLEKLSEATKIQDLYESNTCDAINQQDLYESNTCDAINQQNLYKSNTCDAINQQTDLLSELESRL